MLTTTRQLAALAILLASASLVHAHALPSSASAEQQDQQQKRQSTDDDDYYPYCQGTKNYSLSLNFTWTPSSHPLRYPLADAHFSPVVVASHNHHRLFETGRVATPGLRMLSEVGDGTVLAEEMRARTEMGNVHHVVNFATQSRYEPAASIDSIEIQVNTDSPYISWAAMVAPSPDWFTGANSIDMCDHDTGLWRQLAGFNSDNDDDDDDQDGNSGVKKGMGMGMGDDADSGSTDGLDGFTRPFDAGTDAGITFGVISINSPEPVWQPVKAIECGDYDAFCSFGEMAPVAVWSLREDEGEDSK